MKRLLLSLFLVITFIVLCGNLSACGVNEEEKYVTITYYENQNSEPIVKTIEKNNYSKDILLSKDGYTFLGLFDSPEGGIQMFDSDGKQMHSINSDVILYAQWEKITYKKNFIVKGNGHIEDEQISVKDEDVIVTLPLPEVDYGYEFIGWKLNDTLISDKEIVKDEYNYVTDCKNIWLNNSPLVAEIRKCEYNVTFYYNNGTGESINTTVIHGEKVKEIPDISNVDGMEFVGWSTSMSEYIPYETSESCLNVTSNISLYAYWRLYKKVTFVVNGNEIVDKIYNDEVFVIPDYYLQYCKDGYQFDGWYRTELGNTLPETVISYDGAYPIYYAKFSLIIYDIKFVTFTDKTENKISYVTTDNFDLPKEELEGYTFEGWCEKQDLSDLPKNSIESGESGDKTLYAKYTKKINLNANEGTVSIDNIEVAYGIDNYLPVPKLSYNDFAGWFDENGLEISDKAGKVLSSVYFNGIELTAKWTPIVYNIKFETFTDTQVNDVTYVYSDAFSLPEVTLDGYTFKGWCEKSDLSDNPITKINSSANGDKTLYAKYIKKINLNANGGTVSIDNIDIAYGIKTTLPIPNLSYNIFEGWIDENGSSISDKEGIVFSTVIISGNKLTAKWKLETYTIDFKTFDNQKVDSITYTYSKTTDLPQTTLDGYTFKGWCENSDLSDNPITKVSSTTNGNKTLYAKFTKQISLDAGEGTVSKSTIEVVYGIKNSLPVSTLAYYNFNGWISNEGELISDANGNVAKWNYISINNLTSKYEKKYSNYTYIKTKEEFNNIRKNLSGNYMLIADIDISGVLQFDDFKGILDGKGHTLSSWNAEQVGVGNYGLIGVNNGTIKNLNISNFRITNNDPDTYGTLYAGLVCSINKGTIENVSITNSSINVDVGALKKNENSYIYVGLICGYSNGTISKCGVYGFDKEKCSLNCYVGTKFQGAEACCGGVVGYLNGGTLNDVYCSGGTFVLTVKASYDTNLFGSCTEHGRPRGYLGGIVGYSDKGTITRAISHDNAQSLTLKRDCNHGTNKEAGNGSIAGKRVSSTLSNCYSEKGDTLFGVADSTAGASKLNTENISMKDLPADFDTNGWEDCNGVPRTVVKILE